MQRNLFAYTKPGADFPAYISINERDGKIVVTVRNKGGVNLAEIALPPNRLGALMTALEIERANRKVYGSKDIFDNTDRRDILQNPRVDNRGLGEKLGRK